MSQLYLARGSFSSLAATDIWRTQHLLNQGTSNVHVCNIVDRSKYLWFCRLFQEHLSVFQQHFSVILRHSFVFQWHFFAVFQDDPNCHHGRLFLCHGHHRKLHQWTDLQKVNWNCCSFGLKAMIILVFTILQLHDVGVFVCCSRWWLNKSKQIKFLEKHPAVLATLSVLIRRVAKVVDWWWLWLSTQPGSTITAASELVLSAMLSASSLSC